MTYYEIISNLKACALEEPNINFVGSKDIYELNSLPTIEYNVFYITPNTFSVDEDTITYSLNLYFVSRWDETDNNQLEEQSAGMLALQNIINRFNNLYPEVEIAYPLIYTPFYQKFKDITCGVFVRADFQVDNTLGTCTDDM
jgi:hypothetical protein|nr:MAG TPA: hypothetical protein [Bacteriophage sp.]DAZ42934.1 MAG TPA: hypothetical protein [Caudoviricetes sp.]